jgi:segregation and condensation protein B
MTYLETALSIPESAMIDDPMPSNDGDDAQEDGDEPSAEFALVAESDGDGREPDTESEPGTAAEGGDLFSARPFGLRLAEALLFAADKPVSEAELAKRLPEETDIRAVLRVLAEEYAERGVHLVNVGGGWAFRTAADLGRSLRPIAVPPRKLSRAAIEALAIIAYHQPVTRAEIEQIRGVALSRGTLEILLEAGWIRPRGKRQTPGRPVTWGTSNDFLDHFGLARIEDLPGIEELKAAGLLDRRASVTTLAMRAEDNQSEPDSDDSDETEEIVPAEEAIDSIVFEAHHEDDDQSEN